MQLDFYKALNKLVAAQDMFAMHIAPPFAALHKFDCGLRDALDPHFDWVDFGNTLLQTIPHNKLMVATDTFGICYAMFCLPGEQSSAYIVGPWTQGEQVPERREWVRKHFTAEAADAISEYYGAVRQFTAEEETQVISNVRALLLAAELPETFHIERKNEFLPFIFYPETKDFEEPAFRDELPIALLEQRYAAEADFLDCVARGDETGSIEKMRQMQRFDYGGRFTGSLYAKKNKLIIFNTLLRKAIQKSQVHPYYIDRVSARYSYAIEGMSAGDEAELTYNMLRDYCAYVRRYSLKSYSPLMRKIINQINLHMESDLSLKALAALCHISPSYLSTLFKQELGVTLTDYVNSQRMQRAAATLRTTDLNISAVAEQVGILDVNYFTKMFKSNMGTTPTQYRKQSRDA